MKTKRVGAFTHVLEKGKWVMNVFELRALLLLPTLSCETSGGSRSDDRNAGVCLNTAPKWVVPAQLCVSSL